jgi:hypothetical protein
MMKIKGKAPRLDQSRGATQNKKPYDTMYFIPQSLTPIKRQRTAVALARAA